MYISDPWPGETSQINKYSYIVLLSVDMFVYCESSVKNKKWFINRMHWGLNVNTTHPERHSKLYTTKGFKEFSIYGLVYFFVWCLRNVCMFRHGISYCGNDYGNKIIFGSGTKLKVESSKWTLIHEKFVSSNWTDFLH